MTLRIYWSVYIPELSERIFDDLENTDLALTTDQ